MSDYIKREDAIKAVYSDVTKGTYGEFVDGSEFSMTSREIEAVLKGVPSAEVVEVIAKAKQALLDSTNIESSPDEMKVLNDFLFRCWQMGWLDAYYFMELVRCLGIMFLVEGDIIKVKWQHGDKHYIVPFAWLLELWEKYKE